MLLRESKLNKKNPRKFIFKKPAKKKESSAHVQQTDLEALSSMEVAVRARVR